jgi:squalene-hopene/tetraprenyl-beta-curcumene cyclase
MTLTAGEPKASRAEAPGRTPQQPRRERALRATRAIEDAQGWLLAAQEADGHWCGELEGDTILETEYVLLLHFLGRLDDPRVAKAARYVRRKQLRGGGWAIYPGGPPEVSASVKAYFVLKLAGDDPAASHMARARRTIHELGGIEACNSFTKIYLAICGQYDWWRCPAVPPEMVLLPRWLYFNLYEMSSWSRGIVVPLSIVWALRPVRPVAPEHAIDELRTSPGSSPSSPSSRSRQPAGPTRPRAVSDLYRSPGSPGPPGPPGPPVRRLPSLIGSSPAWRVCFRQLDRALKLGERAGLKPFRRRALARAEAWILERLEDSDGLGAIFPPIVNTIFALSCLGYGQDHPLVRAQIHELERLEIEETSAETPEITEIGEAHAAIGAIGDNGLIGEAGETGAEQAARGGQEEIAAGARGAGDSASRQRTLRLQPCFSAVWDTALAMHALRDSGVDAAHPALAAARGWLIEREVRRTGDWSAKAPGVAPGGWCFEYRNAFYPDCDDTAEVLTALSDPAAGHRGAGGQDEPAVRRGIAWLLGMQNDDGGWGAFDRGCDKEILTHVPFADHNALLDPSTADVTGRVVFALRRLGMAAAAPELARAVAFLRRQQEADGSWYGRWGCNYVYGTWLVLSALASCGDISREPWCRRAADWILSRQNPDGGWGESPRSYDDPAQKGIGPSTAAQTAWALMGLFAAGVTAPATPATSATPATAAIDRGVEYLLRGQREDGSWHDEPWTATGFPRVFYLQYHLYAVYFPLMALSEYRALGSRAPRAAHADNRQVRDEASATSNLHAYPLAVPARTAAVEGAVR